MSRLGIEFMSSCASCQLCGSVYHMHVNSFPNAKIYHSPQFLCMCVCLCVRVYSSALVFPETWQEVWHRKRIMITNKNESAKLSNSSLSANRFTYLRSVYARVCVRVCAFIRVRDYKVMQIAYLILLGIPLSSLQNLPGKQHTKTNQLICQQAFAWIHLYFNRFSYWIFNMGFTCKILPDCWNRMRDSPHRICFFVTLFHTSKNLSGWHKYTDSNIMQRNRNNKKIRGQQIAASAAHNYTLS